MAHTDLMQDLIARFASKLTIFAPEPPACYHPQWLFNFTREKRRFRRVRADAVTPYPQAEVDYIAQCLEWVEYDVLVYRVPGFEKTPIVVVEDYALCLDEVHDYSWRGEEWEPARQQWSEHVLRHRCRPEHLEQHIRELPDGSFIKEIVLLDWDNPYDPWMQQIHNNSLRSLASAEWDGTVFFYRGEVNGYLGTNLKHEWCHRLDDVFKELAAHFKNAVSLEWFEWTYDNSAKKSNGEQFAYLGQELLERDGTRFITAAFNGMLRTTVFMDFLEEALKVTAVNSDCHEIWLARVQFVREHILPLAVAKADERAKLANAAQSYLASRMPTT